MTVDLINHLNINEIKSPFLYSYQDILKYYFCPPVPGEGLVMKTSSIHFWIACVELINYLYKKFKTDGPIAKIFSNDKPKKNTIFFLHRTQNFFILKLNKKML